MNQDSLRIAKAHQDSVRKVFKTYDSTSYFYLKQIESPHKIYDACKLCVGEISKNDLRDDSLNFLKNTSQKLFFKSYTPSKYLTEKKQIMLRYETASQWIFIVLLSLIFLFSFVRVYYNNHLHRLSLSLFNFKEAKKTFATISTHTLSASVMLNIGFYCMMAVFLYANIVFRKIHFLFIPDLLVFIILSFLVFFIYQTKRLLLQLINSLLSKENISDEYHFNVMLYNKLAAIAIFPIVIWVSYIKHKNTFLILNFGFILLLITYLFRIVRGIQILNEKQVSIFYMFLYICTLEIIPLVVFIKLIDIYLLK